MMHDAVVSILRAREKVLCSVVCGEVGLATHRACAVRVTVLGLCVCVSVCLSVCLSVCPSLFSHYRQRRSL